MYTAFLFKHTSQASLTDITQITLLKLVKSMFSENCKLTISLCILKGLKDWYTSHLKHKSRLNSKCNTISNLKKSPIIKVWRLGYCLKIIFVFQSSVFFAWFRVPRSWSKGKKNLIYFLFLVDWTFFQKIEMMS